MTCNDSVCYRHTPPAWQGGFGGPSLWNEMDTVVEIRSRGRTKLGVSRVIHMMGLYKKVLIPFGDVSKALQAPRSLLLPRMF